VGRPRDIDEARTQRVQVLLAPRELGTLDDWAWERRIRSRSEAIRQLLDLGLAASKAGWEPEGEDEDEG
jgi:metal-responsive CopG/Arc/MetJ family transcriptional regulator